MLLMTNLLKHQIKRMFEKDLKTEIHLSPGHREMAEKLVCVNQDQFT